MPVVFWYETPGRFRAQAGCQGGDTGGFEKRSTFHGLPAFDHNDPLTAVETIGKIKIKIKSLDSSAWTDEERESFRVALDDLRSEIDNFSAPSSALA
jgi:hypothetical protein